MNKRVWAVVALFAGIAVAIGVWMGMSTDATTTEDVAEKPKARSKPDVHRIAIDPSKIRGRLPPRASIDRTRLRQAPGALIPGPLRPGLVPPGKRAGAGADGVFPLDQDGVESAVESHRDDLLACYETARFHTPGLPGTMTLVMDVEPVEGEQWGSVRAVDAETEVDAPVFEGCVKTALEDLKFATTEPTQLRYPVSMTSKDEGSDE